MCPAGSIQEPKKLTLAFINPTRVRLDVASWLIEVFDKDFLKLKNHHKKPSTLDKTDRSSTHNFKEF